MLLLINIINYYYFFLLLTEQLIESINSARDLIKTRLMNPEKLPADKKMIELIDDQIKKKLSKNTNYFI